MFDLNNTNNNTVGNSSSNNVRFQYRQETNMELQTYQNELAAYYVMGIAGNLTAVLGMIGNLLSLIIFMKRYKRWLTTDVYLVSLTIIDLLLLVFFLLIVIKDTKHPVLGINQWVTWQKYPAIPHIYPICHALLIVFQVASIWTTTAICCDRFFIVCYPFVAENVCSLRLAFINSAGILIFSLLYNIPRFLEFHIIKIYIPFSLNDKDYHNSTYYPQYSNISSSINNTESVSFATYQWISMTKFGGSHEYTTYYLFYSYILLVIFLPILIIIIVNTLLLYEIKLVNRRSIDTLNHHTTNNNGNNSNNHNSRHVTSSNDTNMLLIGIVFFFLLTQCPAGMSHFTWAFYRSNKQWHYLMNEFGNYLVILNSAINFLPYVVMSPRFRTELKLLILDCAKKKRNRFRFSSNIENAVFTSRARKRNTLVNELQNLTVV